MEFGKVMRRYDFDTHNCRMLDRWWRLGDETHAIVQSLRCYSLDDFRTILEGTGLALESVEPRGAFDFDSNQFVEHVAIGDAMQYLAKLVPENAERRGR